jgi:hypothetical protein
VDFIAPAVGSSDWLAVFINANFDGCLVFLMLTARVLDDVINLNWPSDGVKCREL